jgi:hypothetical protein
MSSKKEVGMSGNNSSDGAVPESKDLGLTNIASVEAGHGDQRELDFMTRNGLNLESFKRRTLSLHRFSCSRHSTARLTMLQATPLMASSSWTRP